MRARREGSRLRKKRRGRHHSSSALTHVVRTPPRAMSPAIATAGRTPPRANVRRRAASQRASSARRGAQTRVEAANTSTESGENGATTTTRPTAETDAALAKEWDSCAAYLRDALSLTEDEAEATLSRAHGWRGQAYWRNSKVREAPSRAALEERVAFLASIGVDAADVGTIARKQPEILGCDVAQLTSAVEHVEKNFFMKRNTKNFKGYLLRVPQALGNNLDCAAEGKACLGECNRCWARC